MTFAPLLPAWLMALVVVAAVAATIAAYRRPSWPAALRLVALIPLAVWLLNPVRVHVQPALETPRLALVVDASASMGTVDGVREGAAASRLDSANAALEALTAELGARYRVEWWSLADALTPGRAERAAGGTRFDGLSALARGAPPAAVVLASDGGDRGDVPPDNAFAAAHVPVFVLPMGGAVGATNATLRLEAASPTVFQSQTLTVTAVIDATPDLVGRPSELVLSDGDGHEQARATVALGAAVRHDFAVAAGDKPGERLWSARLAPVAGEATDADNDAAATVQVVDRPLRILVAEGRPYWDTSFAVRAWRRDQQLKVATLYKVGTRRYRSGDEPPPGDIQASDLAGADVIVLGDRAESLIGDAAQKAIADFVAGGGGLLLIGARDGLGAPGPLAALDPLLRKAGRRTNVVPQLTAAGRALALLPVDLALDGVAIGNVSALRARAEVLLGDDERPVVVARRHGAGRVVAVNGEGLWRWSLAAKGGRGGDETAARFWRQLAKSAARDVVEGLRADRPRYRTGQEAVVACAGEIAVVVTPPIGDVLTLTPADGQIRLKLDQSGRWRLSRGDDRCTLIVEPDVRELVDTARRDDRLARLAAASGGEVLRADAARRLGIRLAQRADLQIAGPTIEPLVTDPRWFLITVAALVAEWWLRRRRHGAV